MDRASTKSDLREIVRVLGDYRGPTRSGFLNFIHKACGDRKYRLGLKGGKFKCFRCGSAGLLSEIVRGVERIPRAVPARGQAAHAVSNLPDPSVLPWKPIPVVGELSLLASRVVKYLASRGIPRVRAAVLGFGYGTAGREHGCAVFPWLRPDLTLGGWQARLTYDPGEGASKIVHAHPDVWPNLYSPSQGAMFGFETLQDGEDVMLVEGPVDTYSGARVIPTAGLMGSEIYAAQIRRLQQKHPRRIFYGLDPDTFVARWNPMSRTFMAPKAHENLRRLYVAFPEVRVIQYPKSFDGDIGGREDKSPHPRSEIAKLVSNAKRYPY